MTRFHLTIFLDCRMRDLDAFVNDFWCCQIEGFTVTHHMYKGWTETIIRFDVIHKHTYDR